MIVKDLELEVEVEIPETIRSQATSIRERLETAISSGWGEISLRKFLNDLVIDATALENELAYPITDTVEIEPPERDED